MNIKAITYLILFVLPMFSGASNITFQSLEVGLSHPYVRCIFKDSWGFMWFGTNDGLTKYDGTNFWVYEREIDSEYGLFGNIVNAVVEDADKNLWIGTSDGLNYYNRELDRIEKVKITAESVFCINSLYMDTRGTLWIGTLGEGVLEYNTKLNEFTAFNTQHNDAFPSDYINCIGEDGMGRLWIGTRAGMVVYNAQTKKFEKHPLRLADGTTTPDYNISDFALEENGDFWVGTHGGGLFRLRASNEISIKKVSNKLFPGNDNILSLCVRKNRELWIGTENGGLTRTWLRKKEHQRYLKEKGRNNWISGNSIWSIYEDDSGILWIGTFDAGVNIVDDSYEKFELFTDNAPLKNSLPNDNVRSFSEDASGNLWIATDGGGLTYFDTHLREFVPKIQATQFSSKAMLAVLYTNDRDVWAGTWGNGIDRYNEQGKLKKNYTLGDRSDSRNNILFLFQDSYDDIWAGTSGGGVLRYNKSIDKFESFVLDTVRNLPSRTSYVSAIYEDKRTHLWFATYFGLIHLERTSEGNFQVQRYLPDPEQNSLSSARVYSVLQDRKGRLWIGTELGLNLFNIEENHFTLYSTKDGLPNNTVRGILEDRNGMLWINTNEGLSKFDPEKKTFTNYTKRDGLNSNELNANACIMTKSGEVFLGGNKGMNAFFPDNIRTNGFIPPVHLTSFMLSNVAANVGDKGSPLTKSITETKRLDLEWNQNSFSIKFAALNYTRPSRNRYAYKLEGFNETWHSTQSIPVATYTNLNPGEYIFKVKGANNDGLWNETPRELVIKISPPYWKTAWAYTLYAAVLIGLFLVFVKLLSDKSRQKYQLEMDTVRWEQERNLLRMRTNFFTNISHELRTPLSLIFSPLQSIVENKLVEGVVLERLRMVYKSVEHLYDLVNELMDFSKLEEDQVKLAVQKHDVVKFAKEIHLMFEDEAQRRSIDFELRTEHDSIALWFDKRRMKKVLMNLLSNAFKNTPDSGKITINLQLYKNEDAISETEEGQAVISVIDNGPGIAEEYIDKVFERYFQSPENNSDRIGTGIGLSLVQKFVTLHHGKVEVTSKKWEETTFSVFLPLGSSHFHLSEISVPAEEAAPQVLPKTEIREGSSNRLVLVVEDNEKLRSYICSFLQQHYHVLEAPDGEIGHEIALAEKPDLIISDVIMPKRSGIELCSMLKSNKDTSHIPIILLSAKTDDQSRVAGVSHGADAYLIKPFNENYVLAVVKNLIETRRSLFKRFSRDVFVQPNWELKSDADQKFIEQIVQYITENVAETDITVEKLAKHMRMNRSSVYRRIKTFTGQTATEFIRRIRLKMAVTYIESGEFNVSEVAMKVGFDSPSYFTKCFKKQFGRLPSEFLPK